MADAEIEYNLMQINESVANLNEKITHASLRASEAENDFILESIAYELQGYITSLRTLFNQHVDEMKKRQTVQWLLAHNENNNNSICSKILEKVDVEQLQSNFQDAEIRSKLDVQKCDEILQLSDNENEDYLNILKVLRDVRYNGEDLSFAITDLENIARDKYIKYENKNLYIS